MAERIIPVLTADDGRLSTTLTYFEGTGPWTGFDGSNSTLFHSVEFSTAGDIVWAGTASYKPTSLQFVAQSGYSIRLPYNFVLYGSTDGATWDAIYTGNTSKRRDAESYFNRKLLHSVQIICS